MDNGIRESVRYLVGALLCVACGNQQGRLPADGGAAAAPDGGLAFDECGDLEVPILGGGCRRVGVSEGCWEGWVEDGEGGCEPILPEDDCPVGTMPVIGEAECQPVGPPPDCWDGWRPDGEGGCEPILPAGDCPDETMPIIGQPTCQPICDTPVVADPDAIHVDADYDGHNGDPNGTQDRPYTTIQAAIDAAADGDQVLLAAGEYTGDVVVDRGIELSGPCPALATVRGEDDQAAALTATAGGTAPVEVRGLQITGPGRGIRIEGRDDVTLEGLLVESTGAQGIQVDGAQDVEVLHSVVASARVNGIEALDAALRVEDVVVRDCEADLNEEYGRGIEVTSSTLSLRRSLLLRNQEVGLLADSSTLDVDEVVIRDTRERPSDGLFGMGLQAQTATVLTLLRHSLIARNTLAGLAIGGASTATVDEVIVRDTQGLSPDYYGAGTLVGAGAAATITESLVAGNWAAGIYANDATVTVEGTVVRDTLTCPWASGGSGHGILAANAADLAVKRSLILRNRAAGIDISEGSSARVEETAIRDTRLEDTGWYGEGISIIGAPEFMAWRVLVEASRDYGIYLQESPARFDEVVVRDTSGDARGAFGHGITLYVADDVKIQKSLISGAREHGLMIAGSAVDIADLVVRDTQVNADGRFGRGINIQDWWLLEPIVRSSATIERVLLAGNHETGLSIWTSDVTVTHLIVRDTQQQEGDVFGHGIDVRDTADVSLTWTLVEDSQEAGIYIDASSAEVANSRVRRTAPRECQCPGMPIRESLGDGVVAVSDVGSPPTTVELSGLVVEDNHRTGVFFWGEGCSGSLRNSLVRRNFFCVSIDHGAAPVLVEGNRFVDNEYNQPEFGQDLVPADAPGR